jgi:hypothetical protein
LLNLTAPVRVAVIDVAGPLADLDCGGAEQPPYTAAWILVCQAGHPLGSIEIPLRDPVIPGAELEREVRRRDESSGLEDVRSLYLTGEFGFGANMAFRTAVLQASGGFDEALGGGTPTRGGEDLAMFVELLMAGHQLAYEPTAIIEHQHRATMADLDRQIYGYGLGFTAMLTAVTLRDPWHLLGLAAIVPAWLRSPHEETSAKRVNRSDDYPPDLARAELRGMTAGPLTYLRARRARSLRRR